MFGILLIPIMLILGIFFLVASITAGVGLALKLALALIFIQVRILLWLIGLFF
jgi:hypothetical protein